MLYLIVNDDNTYLKSITINGSIVEDVVFSPFSVNAKHVPKFMAEEYVNQLCKIGLNVRIEEWKR